MLKAYLNGEIAWPKFSADEVAQIRKDANLTRKGLGALLKVPAETILRWESGAEDVSDSINMVLCVISKLGVGVFSLMKPDSGVLDFVACANKKSDLAQGVNDPQYNLALASEDARVPDSFDPETIKRLRRRLGMNRREFSEFVGISLGTAVNWENGSVAPKGAALALLKILWKWGKPALDFN